MRAAIRFSQVFSVVTAKASGIGFPEKTACSLYPRLVRLTPRLHVASRSVLWLGSSTGLPLSRAPTRPRNAMKSSRRVRRLIVDWSGNSAGRVDGFQFFARHAQLIGRSNSAAHR